MTFLSKVLEDDLLFGMIMFWNDFEMIFSFLYTPLFTLIYDRRNDSNFRYDKRYIPPNFETRGKSSHPETFPSFRKEGHPIIPKGWVRCHIKMMRINPQVNQ